MNKTQYVSMLQWVESRPALAAFIIKGNKILTRLIYFTYPALLVVLFVTGNSGIIKAILIPGVSFLLVSIFRRMLNRTRPYEAFDYKPLIDKNSKGKSFPSRHIFSVFIIGMTMTVFYPFAGVLVFVVGILMGAMRVLGGVHYVSDIVAGALMGICFGAIGFII